MQTGRKEQLELNIQQQAFVDYYTDKTNKKTFGNTTQSAIAANYSQKTAASQGRRLLHKEKIKQEIKDIRAKSVKIQEISREFLIEKLVGIINHPKTQTVAVQAAREIADLCGYHRELALNPEKQAEKRASQQSDRALCKQIAAEITAKAAEIAVKQSINSIVTPKLLPQPQTIEHNKG